MIRTIAPYGIAATAVGLALLLRWALDPVLGDAMPFVTMFGAVAAAVWVGGALPAVAASLLGYVGCRYFFIPPRGQIEPASTETLVGLLAYLFTCGLIVGIGEAMRRAREQAGQQQELLRVTLRSIGDAVITTGVDGRITSLNEAARSLTGWGDEALGQPLETVFHILNEATRQTVESPAARALREGVVVGLANHTILVRKDGAELPIDDSAAPIRDERGRVSGCVLTFRDVTAQRVQERARGEQLLAAQRLASIVDSSDDAIVSKSLDGTIRSWNSAAERVFGYTADQAVGRHISLVIPPERLSEEDEIIAALKAGRRLDHYETVRVRSDGRHIRVSLTISPIVDDQGRVVGASKIARDVTRQRQAEERERELLAAAADANAKFQVMAETSRDFVGMCDLDGMPFFVNRAGLEMVGLDSLDAARRTPMREFFYPEDQSLMMDEFFPAVLAQGHNEAEIRFRHFKTGQPRWMAFKVLTLTDGAGRPTGFATVSQDVTERRRLAEDLRKLAANLSEADRRKNEFLAVLAHELRNPLAPLTNMIEVLKHAEDDPAMIRRAHGIMERQLGQMVRLVDDLLDLNRITHNRLELRHDAIDLLAVVQQAIEASRPAADAAGHELRVTLPAEPIVLRADRARLAQVFGNLIHNSCKYTPPGGSILVSAERCGDTAVVSVKDTGIGIPADKLDSIFEMFTQVDGAVERSQGGLGIGLTLVKQIVHMHGGTIEAKSAGEGSGSEFIVRLPLAGNATAAP